jgi:hypothetical protein
LVILKKNSTEHDAMLLDPAKRVVEPSGQRVHGALPAYFENVPLGHGKHNCIEDM